MAPKRKASAGSASKKKQSNISEIDLEKATKCINTIRVLSADIVEKAKSGHPGAPMGCAPIAHLLWSEFMNYSSSNPKWTNRDRFVLSNGHACALLYSMLHLSGYQISLDDLKQFRQLDSITPGHPENFATPGVEVCTGPLGQGISNAVGMAIAESHLAATFNKENFNVVDHFTYVICGDGCLQEGVSAEASSLAGHLKLGKLIVLYDDNHITIDGETELSFTEDVVGRYNAYGWHTQVVGDANDLTELRSAIYAAQADERPSLIKVRTIIGFGSGKQGTEKVHGAPLGAADLSHVKEHFGFDPAQSFVVSEDVYEAYKSQNAKDQQWETLFADYSTQYPELAAEYTRRFNGQLVDGWKDSIPDFPFDKETSAVGTRNHSEKVLNAIASAVPELVGGSADLAPSNLTELKCSGDFQAATPAGRYFRFGVREHAMAAVCNGIFAHGGLRPFCATFLTFIGYALGAVRLSALSRFGVIYVMTHDSIGLGEDGPTHQPVETLESLRAMPNLHVFRPADGNETRGAYICAMESSHTPSVLAFSRQTAPALEGSSSEKVAYGAYTLREFGESASLIIVSTGTEVQLAVKVAKNLFTNFGTSVRVVSMPSWELFDHQDLAYQNSVFTPGVPVLSIEASSAHGWNRYAHAQYGLHGFGLSAPFAKVYERFGFTESNLVECARQVLSFYEGKHVPALLDYPRFEIKGHH